MEEIFTTWIKLGEDGVSFWEKEGGLDQTELKGIQWKKPKLLDPEYDDLHYVQFNPVSEWSIAFTGYMCGASKWNIDWNALFKVVS
jgi:hypothetical protein